jgi:predicted nucleic acid-binding protein
VTLLDAYAVVALLAGEPAEPEVKLLVREGGCRVTAVNLAEAIDVVARVHRVPLEETRRALEPLTVLGALRTAQSDGEDAWLAADLRIKYYRRRERPLSIADCFLVAHAIRTSDRIATADSPVAEVARAEAVPVVALPDSTGARP